MSTQRFTPEFKEEAVKQVTERGYSVAEVAARLGVSSHSLYKWVKAVIRKRIYKTRDLARSDVFDYIEAFYNRTRRHSHLGGISPEAFERASA